MFDKLTQNPLRLGLWIATAAWLLIGVLQSIGVISFGAYPIGTAWITYLAAIFCALIWFDVLTQFNSKLMPWVYFVCLLHFITFNLVIAYDWYSVSPLVNRAEHFFGGLIASMAAWVVLQEYAEFRALKSLKFKLLILISLAGLFGIANELIELAADYFLHTSTIGPDLWDTNWDLLMNTLGSVAFMMIYLSRILKK